ncbi:MAG: chorismate mutase, partial [Lachnospiraceae bacterium]|nr:chorismate mutase [Lachnospiraceae bacterium]
MTELEQARAIISEADRELAKVFEKRMAAVRTVAAYKRAHG